jgi:hypothetical protein
MINGKATVSLLSDRESIEFTPKRVCHSTQRRRRQIKSFRFHSSVNLLTIKFVLIAIKRQNLIKMALEIGFLINDSAENFPHGDLSLESFRFLWR